MDGDFVEPAAFRLRRADDGQLEAGLSVNWVEHFRKPSPQEAIGPLCEILKGKGRTIGGESKFALVNVGAAKTAALKFTSLMIVTDPEPKDPSHALVMGYGLYNDQVAEEIAKVVLATFPAKR